MSNLASTSGTGSPSLLNTLRQFRPRKRCLQQSATTTAPLPDKCPVTNPPPSQNKENTTLAEAPEPVLKKATPSKGLTQSSRLECQNIQTPQATNSLKESEVVGSGAKQIQVLSTTSEGDKRPNKEPQKPVNIPVSEGDKRPKEPQQPINVPAKKTIKVEGSVKESLVKHTRYMTDRERSLKELRQEFKSTDIMNVLQALVACNWHVGQARTHLLNKTRFRGSSQPSGQGSDERDVKPNVASLNQALRKGVDDDFCSEDIYVKNLKGGLSKVKFLGGFRQHKQLPKALQLLREAQRSLEAAGDDSDNEDSCDENMYVKDLRGGLTILSAFSEPEESEPPPRNTTRCLRRRRRK